jgi:hypothetical protein
VEGEAMKKATAMFLSALMMVAMAVPPAGSELRPAVGLTLFGGAERGTDDHAGAMGGSEILGLYPLSQTWGVQGSLMNQGGIGGYRFGLSAGPVFAYNSGKVGLFGDYVYRNRGDNNFFYLRGVWSHYFQDFDLVLSYSQPLNSVQRTKLSVIDVNDGQCGGPPTQVRTVNAKDLSINELKGIVRYYPTQRVELNAGLLVNSFAGPDRNKTGTGFGGVFGVAFQALDWLIIRPVQGQMDTRERYRITSGIDFVWAPAQEQYSRQHALEKDTAFSVASAAGGTFNSC